MYTGKTSKTLSTLILVFFILASCAPNLPQWVQNFDTLPKIEGFIVAQVFTMKDNIYAQHCDNAGNQLWMKYSNESDTWKRGKYETRGCVE